MVILGGCSSQYPHVTYLAPTESKTFGLGYSKVEQHKNYCLVKSYTGFIHIFHDTIKTDGDQFMNRLDSFPIVKGQVFIQDDSVGWIPINSLPQRDTFYWSYDYLRCFLLGNGQIEGIFTGPVKYHIMCKYFNPRIINDSTTQFDGFSFSSKSLMEHTFVTQPDTTMVLIDSMTIDVDLRNGFLMRQYQSKRNKPVVNGGMMPPINKPVPIIYKKVVLNE